VGEVRVLTPPELVWLLAAVAKADRAAFEQLYAATCAKLHGVVLRILRRKDLADEVIRETYLEIWSNAGQFNPAIATPITWAVAIARNRAISSIRKKDGVSIEDESDTMDVVSETVDPAVEQQRTEELKRLLACMGNLDAERQRLVLLAYYSGWTREQLAAKLDKPVQTVKTLLQRSLAEILGSMTFEEAHNNEPLASEYVLGTLDAGERAEAQALLETNAVFAAQVRYWERRLGELNSMVQAVELPAETWRHIAARLEGVAASENFVLPSIEEPVAPDKTNIIDLVRGFRYWREGTIVVGTVAATLAGLVATFAVAPDAMPAPLRPRAQVVEVVKTQVVKSEAPPRFVAVLQQNNTSPAFILTVDIEGRNLTVRRVAADTQAGKSYELWLVSDRFPTPKSLGVVGNSDFVVDNKLTAYDAATITGATYAVSLEPEGGSPTGVATGPILWTGRLVQALPGARRLSQASRIP
jgi:RNA polymerase sigma-70 factor, ECF subfamily